MQKSHKIISDRAAAGWVFAFFLCLYLLVAGGHYGGDGFWNYLTAESIVLDGDLIVGDRPFLVREMVHQFTEEENWAETQGKPRYSKYGLGMALAEVPFYLAGHWLSRLVPPVPGDYLTMFTTATTNVFVCAVWSLVFFEFTGRLDYRPHTRLWLTGIFGLGSMAFPYSGYGFSEPLVGLCLLGSVLMLYRYRRQTIRWRLAAAGALSGMAIATKIYVVIVLPALIFYIWPELGSRPWKRQIRSWMSIAIPLGVFALLIAWHNWVRYGSILKTGYHLDDLGSEFWTGNEGGYFTFSPLNIGIAIYGFLLSTGRGLIFFLPVAFLLPAALRPFSERHRREAVLFVALAGLHIGFYACFRAWHGGSCWGPRYLLPAIPFLILPLGSLLEGKKGRAVLLKILGVIGGLVQFPATLTNFHLFIRFVKDHRIGDLIYFPRQSGDLLFTPGVSPVLGAYCQLASAVYRHFTGESIRYPVPSSIRRELVSLDTYDAIDVWWINALRTGLLEGPAAVGSLAVPAALMLISVASVWPLIRWMRASANRKGK